MGIKIKDFTFDNYLDTDMKTLCLYLNDTKNISYVEEIEVPENEKYMMFVSKQKNKKNPDWIEIINPIEIVNKDLKIKEVTDVDKFDMEHKSLGISLKNSSLKQLITEILLKDVERTQ